MPIKYPLDNDLRRTSKVYDKSIRWQGLRMVEHTLI